MLLERGKINMKQNEKSRLSLTFSENYRIGYEIGFRLGTLEAAREILINIIKDRAKEQNYKISKDLLRKIQYETDSGYLRKLAIIAINDDVDLKEVEEKYDEIFRTEEEIKFERFTIYHKYNKNE